MSRTPLQTLQTYWSMMGKTFPQEIFQFINVKKTESILGIIYTYSPKSKNGPDDAVYSTCPKLLEFLPRAMSLLNSENTVIHLVGPRKFAGASVGDDDDDEEHKHCLYNSKKTTEWAERNILRIVATEKANGKFAICRVIIVKGVKYIFFGSKNRHVISRSDCLPKFLAKNTEELSDIVYAIGMDIQKNLEVILGLMDLFTEGFSLTGELCDGLHFTSGDGSVKWFGLFKKGIAKDPLDTIQFLCNSGLNTVVANEVFTKEDSVENLGDVFKSVACVQSEGLVLHCINIQTGETQLVKVKTSWYKVLRALREKIKNLSPKFYYDFAMRLIDMESYHGLNTNACIRVYKIACLFVEWMFINQKLPTGVVNFLPVKSLKGSFGMDQIGFSHWWSKFNTATGNNLLFTSEDFEGELNKDTFWDASYKSVFPQFPITKTPTVIFTQWIQGGGKSTLAHLLKEDRFEQVEQDECYGDTKTCQFNLYWCLCNGLDVIVSRCNANEKQYQRYVSIAHDVHAKVVFLTSNGTNSPLWLAVCLAGVLTRTTEGDKVMVGRMELPFSEVLEFTSMNFKSFKLHPQSHVIDSFTVNPILEREAGVAFQKGNLEKFVSKNKDELMSLRRSPEQIASDILDFVSDTPRDKIIYRSISDTSWIGLHLIPNDVMYLENLLKKLNVGGNGKCYCEHLTQAYMGYGKKKSSVGIKPAIPGDTYFLTIRDLVVDKNNGSAAYRVENISGTDGTILKVKTGRPHITACVASGHSPAESVGFVYKNDESVLIFSLDEPIIVSSVCRYH